MAVKFLEPGGDSDFGISLWPSKSGAPAVATDFVHGGHIKSIQYRTSNFDYLLGSNFAVDAGGRVSIWVYFNAFPSAAFQPFLQIEQAADGNVVASLLVSNTGVLNLAQGNGHGSPVTGATLSLGIWYRVTLAWKITSTTVNEFRVFLMGLLNISQSNFTLDQVSSADIQVGNGQGSASLDFRSSDHYIDDSNSLLDPGNIWVTAKRPFANGTVNGFSTQIGAGSSGYGSGHALQVNERPQSDTNGWSIIGSGSAVTEEYNIESISQGDIDITGAKIVDYMGWVRTGALAGETGNIIVNNVQSAISITTSTSVFRQVAGSSTYPSGTGTDIGEITSTTVTTVSLYECGIAVAYIPAVKDRPGNEFRYISVGTGMSRSEGAT